jgi:hypothetical protein
MAAGIYCITSLVTGDRYIGSSVNVHSKLYQWQKAILAAIENQNFYYGYNRSLLRSAIQYGFHAFHFQVLEDCSALTRLELRKRECQRSEQEKPSYNIRRPCPAGFDYVNSTQKR